MQASELESALEIARRVLCNRHDAEDLAQEAVIRIWLWKGRKLDPEALAKRVAKQVVARHTRSDAAKAAAKDHAYALSKVLAEVTSARSFYADAGQAADFYRRASKKALRLVSLRMAGFSDKEIGRMMAPGKTSRTQRTAVSQAQEQLEKEAHKWL